jgi:SAM-dependent methyltransferase
MKRYDRAYFERWYRVPRTRIHLKAAVERKVAFVVHAAEYLLQRPIDRVLDVGCGEAPWQPILQRLRPGVGYAGVDSSTYAVRRFGRARNLRLGSFGRLGELGLEGPYDLIVCSDMLHYVPMPELKRGLPALAELLGGAAFIEVFTAADSIMGDMREIKRRRPATYERLFREAGLVHCGLYCFVREDFAPGLTAFEGARGGALRRRW